MDYCALLLRELLLPLGFGCVACSQSASVHATRTCRDEHDALPPGGSPREDALPPAPCHWAPTDMTYSLYM